MYEALIILLGIAIGATLRDLRVAFPLAMVAALAIHVGSGEWKMSPEFVLWDLGQAVLAVALTRVLLTRRVHAQVARDDRRHS